MKKVMLLILGVGLLLLTASALAWDLVAPDVPKGTAAAQQGFRIGYVFGIGMRTLVLGGLGLGCLRASGMLGRAISPHDRMCGVLDAHLHQVPKASPANGDLYAGASDDDLLVVYAHLDQKANPERFAALLWEISKRTKARPNEAGVVL